MKLNYIDNGKDFDFGKTSKDYALFRDIYTEEFYETLHCLEIGRKGQHVLDIGTGTGVIPRNMYQYGATFVGTDISENQIAEAKRLSEERKQDIIWKVCSADHTGYADNSFDVITAVQCWWYFDRNKIIPEVMRLLKPKGKLAIITVNWLPGEDRIAKKTEELVLKYNPDWKGANYQREDLIIPDWIEDNFRVATLHTYDDYIKFSRESWAGRIRACRGIGASLNEDRIREFDQAHMKLLEQAAPEEFTVLHQVVIKIFTVNK